MNWNQLRRSADGQAWFAMLREALSLVSSQEYLDAAVAGQQRLEVSLPVAEIPRTGTPQRVSRGLSIYPIPGGVSICSYGHSSAVIARAQITGVAVEARDASGRFEVEAELVQILDGAVELRRQDGRRITVKLERLSEEDRRFVAEQPPKED